MQNSTINPNFHVTLCESILKDIRDNSSRYYYFFGKTLPYNQSDSAVEPLPTINYEYQTRKDIIALKRITNNDVSFVIPRYDWVNGSIYDHYDDSYSLSNPAYSGATSLETSKFYVIDTETLRIYKCLDNNNNAQSTERPSNADIEPFITSDGYKWKFMMEIPTSLKQKFLTKHYIPVNKALYTRFYNNAGISDITIVDGGTNYSINNSASISIPSSSGHGAILQPVVKGGEIIDVVIVRGGYGYTNPTNLVVNSDIGTGCILEPILNDIGSITGITIVNSGKHYPINPIANVLSTSGTGAIVEPIIENGSITNVIIVEPGEGYFDAEIQVTDLTGSGAVFQVVTSFGSVNTKQAVVENSAVPGSIEFIKVINSGTGYTNPTIVVEGDGSGCTATPILNEFGSIEKIIITNSGQNYSVATVNIIDSTGLNASVRSILSPLGGHGSNAIKELYSSRLMFSTELKNTLFFGHKVSNDFRQFGIIKTPLKPDGTFLNSDIPVNCYSTATITNYSIDKFPEDSILYTWNNGIDKRFTIISREVTVDGFKLLLLPMDKAELMEGSQLFISADTYIIIGNVIKPDMDSFSGDILYTDNRASFYQSEEQLVSLQTVIKF